jgi:hypothetical protein
MNKNLMILGAAVVGGFITLTAFGPKTKVEQMADIKTKIEAGLEEFRAAEVAKCDERVAAEVKTQYDAMLAAAPAPAIAAPMPGKKAPAKKAVKPSGPKVDPLPQGSAGTKPADQKTRGGAVQEGNIEQQKTRSGAVPTADPAAQKKRGGAVKVEGGGN